MRFLVKRRKCSNKTNKRLRWTLLFSTFFVLLAFITLYFSLVRPPFEWTNYISLLDIAWICTLVAGGSVSSAAAQVFEFKVAAILRKDNEHPSLAKLICIADFLPTALRKKVRAMVCDYDEQIRTLFKKKRYKAARWNQWMAWGFAIWYVLRGPTDAVFSWAIGLLKTH